jgi:hypothetical protein
MAEAMMPKQHTRWIVLTMLAVALLTLGWKEYGPGSYYPVLLAEGTQPGDSTCNGNVGVRTLIVRPECTVFRVTVWNLFRAHPRAKGK